MAKKNFNDIEVIGNRRYDSDVVEVFAILGFDKNLVFNNDLIEVHNFSPGELYKPLFRMSRSFIEWLGFDNESEFCFALGKALCDAFKSKVKAEPDTGVELIDSLKGHRDDMRKIAFHSLGIKDTTGEPLDG